MLQILVRDLHNDIILTFFKVVFVVLKMKISKHLSEIYLLEGKCQNMKNNEQHK